MAALEVITDTDPRSPSPIVPGAWPSSPGLSTSLHKRFNTFPGHTVPLADPLHLDHVHNFHQRLSRTLFRRVDSTSGVAVRPLELTESRSASSDIVSTPSDGSNMTRFTQHDTSTSLSMFGETSDDTACSSPSRGRDEFPVYPRVDDSDIQNVANGKESRIQSGGGTKARSLSLPDDRPIEASQPPSHPQQLSSQDPPRPQRPRITMSTSRSHSSWSSHPSPDAVSPISFSSPTLSSHAVPFRSSYHGSHYSPSLGYSSSLSWETSFGSHLSDVDSPQAETPPITSPRPARILRRARLEPPSDIEDCEHNESSAEVDIPLIPMLTTLSLPGSVDTTLDISRRGSLGHSHGLQSALPHSSDASDPQISLPGSSLSPSPVISDGTADIRLPSPSASLSPFIAAPCPRSPTIHLTTADSSTLEYAAAVVSSAWGEDISVHPADPGADSFGDAVLNSRPGTSHEIILDPVLSKRPFVNTTLVTRMKKFSRRVKKFLTIRTRYPGMGKGNLEESAKQPDATHERISEPLAASVNASSPPEAHDFHELPGEDPLVSIEGGNLSLLPLPLPPGLSSPSVLRKACPSLSRDTYTSASISPRLARHSMDHSSPPLIRITSSACSHRTYPAQILEEINDNHAPENDRSTLEIKARPKTLAEIKSKRRLSLSGLSHFSRSTSQPSSSMVAIATARPRPPSTIIFTAASSSSIADEDAVHVGIEAGSVPVERNVLRMPAPSRSPLPGQRRSSFATRTPTPDRVADSSAAHQKKNRRFSLSALSNLVNNSIRGTRPIPESV